MPIRNDSEREASKGLVALRQVSNETDDDRFEIVTAIVDAEQQVSVCRTEHLDERDVRAVLARIGHPVQEIDDMLRAARTRFITEPM